MPTRRALFAAATLATASFAGVAAPAHAVTANPGSDTRPAFGKGVPMRTNAVKARVAPNTYASTVPTVTTGSSWQNIRAVHYLLLARGIRVSAWETTYGPATRQAVLTFQRKYNLRGSGVALSGTIERLLAPVVKDQNTYRTYAIQTLLKRHGYQFGVQAAPPMNTFYDANTDRLVQTFQTAHGLGATTQTGPLTWATLFADRTSGPVYPLAQAGTGTAQWTNCGPTSAVALLVSRGVTPNRWAWNVDSAYASPAVNGFRYSAMGVTASPARDKEGTSVAELRRGFAAYGFTNVTWRPLSTGLADVRDGSGIILSGDAYRLPWKTRTRGPAGHWITVLGFDGSNYLAVDPISAADSTVLHRITPAQIATYVAGKYGTANPNPYSTVLVH